MNKQFMFYDLGQNFSFLTMMKLKIGNNLPKRKKSTQIFYMLYSKGKSTQ